MKKNVAGFPDYCELVSKLNLENNLENYLELKGYINYMYNTYNQLYHDTCNMSPEEIKFIKNLKLALMTLYEDELKNCKSITEINNNILALLMRDTDYRTAARNIFKAYIMNCIDYFNRNINSTFSRDK